MNKVVKLSLILFLVSAVVAGVLGLTNFVTAEPIAEYQAEVTAKAYSAVMEFESYDEVEYTGDQSAVTKVCKTNDGNWIVEAEVSGSQGMITVAVGVNADLSCNGISIISSVMDYNIKIIHRTFGSVVSFIAEECFYFHCQFFS